MNKEKNKRKITFDVLLVVILLTAALIAVLIMNSVRESGAFVSVTVGGEQVGVYSLAEDGEYSLNGGTNILAIENGEAYMKNTDCPDKTCVHSGKVSRTGERITCLPNRVIVIVRGADEEILESR